MPLFIWSDEYSVNIKEMDQQHKQLVGLINFLYEARNKKGERGDICIVLDELVDYTKVHFSNEEKLMRKHKFPEYDAHKSMHGNLVQQVSNMQKNCVNGNKNTFTDIAILLNDWLAEHIMIEDKKYSIYVNGNGKGRVKG